MKFLQYLIVILLCTGCVSAIPRQSISAVAVYIECTKEGQPVSRGTGVLVSKRGHVLTAKHVVPDGYECRGVPGNPTLPTRGLIRDPRSMANVDATMLRFIPGEGETFPSVKFCKLNDNLKGRTIKARGFHLRSKELSIREGVISTTNWDGKGVIETDVETARGMSGGPVMLGNSSSIIGIIAGVEFDPGTGQPIYYGVLAAEVIANTFQLVKDSNSCSDQSNNKPLKSKPNVVVEPPRNVKGPSIMTLPGTGKSFDQFRKDDHECRTRAFNYPIPNHELYKYIKRPGSPSNQYRYDLTYIQCMYAKGHRVPVSDKLPATP